jgi:4,5-DOPA dioxygenase extradiol
VRSNDEPARQCSNGVMSKSALPSIFLSHGSPMIAIEPGEAGVFMRRLGPAIDASFGRPQAILAISAHTTARAPVLLGAAQHETIHDFGGFPQELFDQQYPAPGAPALAKQIAAGISEPQVGLDAQEWGLDHGTWSVLKPMFPKADIPVLQLSMDYGRPPSEHFALGQHLKGLRERGVLVVGSGNIVHNLRAVQRSASATQAYPWAFEFDAKTAELLEKGALAELTDFQKLGQVAQMAHPTYDHYLPLLHAAGAVHAGEKMRFFSERFQAGSISMRSVVWG